MKSKAKIISSKNANSWIECSNLFSKSLINPLDAIRQFNKLSINDKNNIRKRFSEYDEIRRKKIPTDEENLEDTWIMSVMVDSHIIATEYNIDPLTAVMCINPPCKLNEKIIIKN